MKVGVKGNPAVYYSSCMHFPDVWKMFGNWSQTAEGITALGKFTYDANGELTTGFAPLTDWHTYPQCQWGQGAAPYLPLGVYDFVFDGNATFLKGDLPVQVTPNHYQWTANGSNFPLIRMLSNDPTNLFRNAHFYLPGQIGSKSTWMPAFGAFVKNFNTLGTGSLTNVDAISGVVTDWSQRTQPTQVKWGPTIGLTGVPYEALISLCNDRGVNPWVDIPFSASDDYVLQLSTLFKSKLHAGLTLYVEYGNEVWNWGYKCSRLQQTMFAPDVPNANFYGHTNWYPYRVMAIAKIIRGVYGEDNPNFKQVLSSQFAFTQFGTWLAQQAQVFAASLGTRNPDCFAIAPYFPLHPAMPFVDANKAIIVTVDQVIGELAANLATTMRMTVRQNYAIAKAAGMDLVTYEAGQTLTGQTPDQVAFYLSVNRDQRMHNLYMQYLEMLAEEGVVLANMYCDIFAPGPAGSWGMAESSEDAVTPYANAPKLRGILEWMGAN